MDNINLNINKDDNSLNDYLYSWGKFGERPNKINLHTHYNPEEFIKYIDSIKNSYDGIFTEIIPIGQDHIINDKILININDGIFISYVQYDKLIESTVIGDVSILYRNSHSDEIQLILEELNKKEIDITKEDAEQRITIISINQTSLELDPIELLKADYDNINYYFNKDVIKKSDRLIKNIKKRSKGLSIIYGERGVGKTTLVNYIISNINKMVIFIPCSMIELTINNPEFRNFVRRYKDSIIIIDDCEIYFSEIYSKSNIFTNNLLQLVDGFQSDDLNLNIITIVNEPHIENVDHILLECNNLIDIIEVDFLSKNKVDDLNELLGNKGKNEGKEKLINVLYKRNFDRKNNEIGYK